MVLKAIESSCPFFSETALAAHLSPTLYLHEEAVVQIHDCTSHTRRMQYCSDSLPDEALQKLRVKRVRVSLGDH